MEIYIALVSLLGKTETHNLCENLFWTPYANNEKVIEACGAQVWKDSFPLSYK